MEERIFRLDAMSMNFLTAFDDLPPMFPIADPCQELLKDTFGTAAESLQHQMVESQIPIQGTPLPPFENFWVSYHRALILYNQFHLCFNL